MKALVVEDDPSTRTLLERVLRGRGHDVDACADAESAWTLYQRESHPLVILDWLLPGMDGLELCHRMRQLAHGADSIIIVETGRDRPEDLIKVLDAGADDYLTKPVDARLLAVRLTIAERHLNERATAALRVDDLRRMLDQRARLEDLIGKSKPMVQVFELIRQLATVDTTVLIEGDTGTGKELAARAIHSLSRRQAKPFVAVNCAGLTESLIASQLFGHRRGAFTGAIDDHKGFFETADGGTIFLDEIGDLPLGLQTSLLRVLQEREIMRLGDSTPRKIDVRVLTATHRDLASEIAAGRFRSDLFYRIRVARIQLPRLCDRREDIPILAMEFLRRASASSGKRVDSIAPATMRELTEYDWPGNVRELASAIEFGVIRAHTTSLAIEDLPVEIVAGPSKAKDEANREDILAAIAAANGNRSAAAKALGMSRATFYRRLTDLGLSTREEL